MIQPGDAGRQGYPVEDLEVDSETTMQDAHDIIEAYLEGEDRKTKSDAVINIIDFRKNNTFLWCSDAVPDGMVAGDGGFEKQALGPNRVVQTNQFSRRLGLAHIEAQPGGPQYEDPADPDEFLPGGYIRLLRDWLRGNVIELRTETHYYREDTDEEVHP